MAGFCEYPGTTHDGDIDAPADAPNDAIPIDADLSCSCTGNTLACGGQADVACTEGCNPDPAGPRCNHIAPSNNLMWTPSTTVDTAVVINANTFVDTFSGEINGAFHRDPGEGEKGGIIFSRENFGGQPIGVFWMKSLQVNGNVLLKFVGSRSAAVIVATTINVDGTIDVSGGCGNDATCAGPGGGTGAYMNAATGCSPGKTIDTDLNATPNNDPGGGGGGGGGVGGAGGMSSPVPGAGGGMACINAALEPLTGGSGGGRGALSNADPPLTITRGGGGGGGLQLSANVSITIGGRIDASGNGGEGGVSDGTTASAGNGGGAGGGILIEAPTVTLANQGRLAANGGGGGAGGGIQMNNGQKGQVSFNVAAGGAALAPFSGGGGNGGSKGNEAQVGGANLNGGGGGGSYGVIVIRAIPATRTLGNIITPAPSLLDLRVR